VGPRHLSTAARRSSPCLVEVEAIEVRDLLEDGLQRGLERRADDLPEPVPWCLGHGLPVDPEPALVQGNTMLAVQPSVVAVAELLEPPRLEAGGEGELAEPSLDGDVDAIRSRVPDHETDAYAGDADPAERHPGAGEVGE